MNPWRGLKNIPRNVWLVAFATLINRSGTMVMPFLVLYLTKSIGVSDTAAGTALAFYGIGALFTSPVVGRLSDKLGALRVMKISLIATGFFLILFSLIKNYYGILIMILVWSIISESFRPANLSLISEESEPEQRKTSFALNRLAINLGMSIGPVIGGFLSTISFSLLFYVDGITSILAGLFLIFVNIHPRRDEKILSRDSDKPKIAEKKNESFHALPSIFNDKKFLLFMIAIIPVELVFFQHFGAYPLYIVQHLKHSTSTYGLLITINTVLIILTEVPLNNAMSNLDDKKLIALGALLCAVGFGAMAISGNLWFIALTIIVWTFGEMIFFPATASLVSKVAPENRSGEYMGYFQMTFSFSLMFGPWFGTLIFDKFGSTVLWTGAFFFAVTTALSFLFMKNDQQKQFQNN